MAGFLVILFPVLLLGFLLFMGKVEEPLSRAAPERDVERFLETANAAELETFVEEGTESGLRRLRHRLRFSRRRGSSRRKS